MMQKKQLLKILLSNIYSCLVIRLILIMGLYMVCRIAFYLFNADLFRQIPFADFLTIMKGGVVFDLSAVLYCNLLYMLGQTIPFRFRYNQLYQNILKYLFFITNGIALIANCADIVYYRFTLRRTTGSIFQEFEHESNLGLLLFRFVFVDYWYITLLCMGLILTMIILYKKIKITPLPKGRNVIVDYGTQTVVMFLIILLTVGGIRGDFKHSTRPITLSNAPQYTKQPNEASIVLNTPFSIIRTLGRQIFPKINYYSAEDVAKRYSPLHTPPPMQKRKKNVMVFILESFGKEYFGAYNSYKGYTPFLDSLIQQGYSFKHSYGSGAKSVDALPSVISSIPSLRQSYILSYYSLNKTYSLASLLNGEGYHTAFFHGAPNGSMGFLAYINANGFQEYYGKNEYQNDEDFDGYWGIWDDKFFGFAGETINTFSEPFLSVLFSLSSHHPFRVPPQYEGKFPKGTLDMHQVIGYTDYALRRFFEKASTTEWYKNTLFVFTADHTNQSEKKKYQTSIGSKEVPIFFFDPSGELQGTSEATAQQIDIMPTVLSYLGYDKPYIAFGEDLLNDSLKHFAVSTSGSTYQWVEYPYLIHFNNDKTTGIYNLEKDQYMLTNLLNQPSVALPQKEMTERVKAFIQQYNNRIIENNLILEANPPLMK